MKGKRMYPNKAARAARLFRAQQRRRATSLVVSDARLLANQPDTEVSELHVAEGLEADVAAQLARLDRAIESLAP